MLSASYILYYYQDILGVSAFAMGVILLAARVFDAFNDPIMGVVVAKTRTRWGKFRPWLFIGTILNAIMLYLMFSAPPALDGGGLVAYAAVTYVLWGVTYTMMDIPYWSMIPAFTEGGKEREGLSTMARSCAGVGSAIITIITMLCVYRLGGGDERVGFKWFALIIAILFVLFTTITCVNVKEKSTVNVDSPSVGQMFRALIQNDPGDDGCDHHRSHQLCGLYHLQPGNLFLQIRFWRRYLVQLLHTVQYVRRSGTDSVHDDLIPAAAQIHGNHPGVLHGICHGNHRLCGAFWYWHSPICPTWYCCLSRDSSSLGQTVC